MLVAGGLTLSTHDELRFERALATGRVLLATGLLLAAWVQPHASGPTLLIQIAATGYLLFAGVVLALLQFTSIRPQFISLAAHLGDTAYAATLMVGGGGGAAAVASGFCLLGAAYRWGRRATMGTAMGLSGIQVTQVFASPILAGTAESTVWASPGADAPVTRAAYVLVSGLLLGYLAQTERHLRVEASVVADVASRLDVRLGLTRAITVALEALLRLFDAARGVVVVRDLENGRVTRWDGSHPGADSRSAAVTLTHLDGAAARLYLSALPAPGVHVVRRAGAEDGQDAVWIDGSSQNFPAALAAALGPFDRLMAVDIMMAGQWTGRVFLLNPRVTRDRTGTVALAHRLAGRLVPAVYNIYLLRRVRARSVAEERARMARELHDTVVQSVLGVQVQLHALASQASGVRRELAADLTRLGLTLREEVLRLREIMQQMKPVDPTPEQLMDAIAARVQRFETETGIKTRFITCNDNVPLLPRSCLEVMRIVQEALVNVRRHSGAQNVFIRFSVEGDICRLWIDDDGRGFPFEGRLSLQEMDKQHQGPWVIKDRVRRLGGEITVESVPGRGSRIEISFPVTIYALQ